MYNILFVDDEPNILSALKRVLRQKRGEWQMEFAHSGEHALSILAVTNVDVIISDICMPGMDGIQLLTNVKNQYPKIIRMALSGQVGAEIELECVHVAHQFLAKPMDVKSLQAEIESSSKLKLLLDNERLKTLLGAIDTLPSIPQLYQRILQEATGSEGSIAKVGEIISEDLAMSAKILQLVNSAFFGLPIHVESIKKAVSFVGFDIIRSLVLSQKVFSSYEKTLEAGLSLPKLVRHSNNVSALARKIAIEEKLPAKKCSQVVMASMLHNIGKLVLADQYPERYAKVIATVKKNRESFQAAEIEEFGISHEVVGGYLLGIWGLPDNIVEAVAFHHTPGNSAACEFNVLTCVYLATCLIHACERGLDEVELMGYIDTEYIRKLSLDGKINKWMHIAQELEFNERNA